MMLSAGTHIGPYEVIAPLGAGGMGEVYAARDARLGREVAVKILPAAFAKHEERLQRFEQEARSVSSLNHPNILTIFDSGVHEGSPYLVSELLEGSTLRERLRGEAIPQRKVIDYARQIARGLAAAHDKRIVHRDLKPENIFLLNDGRAKILDFGLAKLTQPESQTADGFDRTTATDATRPGAVLGTVGYMSPEQVRGRPVDTRADVFSFGAILYEMLTGERAFRGDSDVEVMHAILKAEPAELTEANPKLGPALARIVRHCLEKDPRDRFQSAQDLAFALEALSVTEVSGLRAAWNEPAPTRRRWPVAVAAAAIAAIVTLAIIASPLLPNFGSGPEPSFRRLAFRRGTIPAARFFPDGETIVYGAAFEGKPIELFTTRVDAPESRPLGIGNAGVLAIGGNLAISLGCKFQAEECQGTLAQVPLTGGAPREILENVRHADWASDGKRMAVVRSMEGSYQLEFPIGKVLYRTPGWICDMRISPDGDRIAFLEHPTLGVVTNGLISVIDSKGDRKVLSSGWKDLRGLAWNGADEIWFTAGESAGNKSLYSVTVSGRRRLIHRMAGNPILLDISRDRRWLLLTRAESRVEIMSAFPGSPEERDFSWFDSSWVGDLSWDGNTLVFTEWGEAVGSVPTAYLRKTDGIDPIRLGPGRALALSPDERLVVAVQPANPPQLVLLPTGAGEQKTLPRGSITDYWWAAWFPDGRRILVAGDGPRGPATYVQDLSGGEPRRLGPEGLLANLVSPDGKLVAGQNTDGTYVLYPVDGSQPRDLPGTQVGDELLQWSSDGRTIYVHSRESSNLALNLYSIDLTAGRRELLRRLAPPDPTGLVAIAPGPGTVRLTPNGKSYSYTYSTVLHQLYLVAGLK